VSWRAKAEEAAIQMVARGYINEAHRRLVNRVIEVAWAAGLPEPSIASIDHDVVLNFTAKRCKVAITVGGWIKLLITDAGGELSWRRIPDAAHTYRMLALLLRAYASAVVAGPPEDTIIHKHSAWGLLTRAERNPNESTL